MRFRKMLVSDNNNLVLSDYNLNNENAEIIDLNKSINDVIKDFEIQTFINSNVISNEKIYFICLKENFGSHEQRIENINNLKEVNKSLNKLFKKKNIFFFIYNIFNKNVNSYAPSIKLEKPNTKKNNLEKENNMELNMNKNLNFYNEKNNTISDNKDVGIAAKIDKSENEISEKVKVRKKNGLAAKISRTSSKISKIIKKNNKKEKNVLNKKSKANNQRINTEKETYLSDSTDDILNETMKLYNQRDIIDIDVSSNKNIEQDENPFNNNNIVDENYFDSDNFGETSDETIKDDQTLNAEPKDGEEINSNVENSKEEDLSNIDLSIDIDALKDGITDINVPTSSLEPVFEKDDQRYLVDKDWNNLDVDYFENNLDTTISSDDSIEIPESYFSIDNSDLMIDDDLYSDYLNFKDSYELNVHALKSIYDFIWRMLISNNYNLKLSDLLYLSINNLSAFSIGQSDFIRQISLNSKSLFDLIMQLDVKLEFNNTLFYIYLSEFFTIKLDRIIVNEPFLTTLSIWVNKNSKHKFIEQVEKFINFSAIYNKKIIFSHFIELANFVKGSLLSIKPSINLIDINRLATNKYKNVRPENIFGFMIQKVNEIFDKIGISIENEIFETPDNMYDKNRKLSDDLTWKDQLISLYYRLLLNIKNFILSKGNNENEIFNLYIDIKDLKMYNIKIDDSSSFFGSFNNGTSGSNLSNSGTGFLTIGDAFNRTVSSIPKNNEDYKENDFNNIDLKNEYINFLKSIKNRVNKENEILENDDELLNNIDDGLKFKEFKTQLNKMNFTNDSFSSKDKMSELNLQEKNLYENIKEKSKEIYSNDSIRSSESIQNQIDQTLINLKKNKNIVKNDLLSNESEKDLLDKKKNQIIAEKTNSDFFTNNSNADNLNKDNIENKIISSFCNGEINNSKNGLNNCRDANNKLLEDVNNDLIDANSLEISSNNNLFFKNKVAIEEGSFVDKDTNNDDYINANNDFISGNVSKEDINLTMKDLSQEPNNPLQDNTIEEFMISKIEHYEKKIKDNISKIDSERKLLKEKIEMLKNI